MSQRTIQLTFFVSLTLLLLAFSFFVFKPYLGVVFLAAVFSVAFHPLYEKFVFKFGNKGFASFATIFVIFVCLLVPATLLSIALLREAVGLYNSIAFGGLDKIVFGINNLLTGANGLFGEVEISSYFSISGYFRDFLGWIIGHFDSLFSIVFGGIFNFVLMLLTLYYFLIYGDKIKKSLIFWSPLPDRYDEDLFLTLRASVDAVMRGRLLVSLAQGFFIGVGFLIFGVGNPVLWGFVGVIASLVPILGTSIVTLPAIVYLFVTGSIFSGVGLLLWAFVCVGFVDNVLSVFLLKDKIAIHPLIILFAILGGVEFFGPVGFIAGPVLVSAFISLLKIYPFIISLKGEQSY